MAFLAGFLTAFGPIGVVAAETPRLEFWRQIPSPLRCHVSDDIKFLIGWTFDAAASRANLTADRIIDASSGFARVPGFAPPTPMTGLKGRYRVLRPPFDRRPGYYGVEFGALDAADRVVAVLLANRLFRMPIAHLDPGGLLTDVVTNVAMLTGIRTAAVADAESAGETVYGDAQELGVPLITSGQSQAGGTAQLQAAYLQKQHPHGVPIGFVTFSAAHVLISINRIGLTGAAVDGVNFSKDLDPGVGPKALFANRVGLQIYIHPDGTGGRTPGDTSFLDAMLHPREHFLDSFKNVSLSAALTEVFQAPEGDGRS